MVGSNKKGLKVEISNVLIGAAQAVALGGTVADKPVEVPGFRKMFVSKGDCSQIQPLHFFTVDDTRYVIGALKK